MLSVNFNGKIIPADGLFIHADNRSFRYGEGLFETVRLQNGTIPLWKYHWQRLSSSLPQLYFEMPKHFSSDELNREVIALCQKNKAVNARIRITFFKGEGGLWERPTSSFNYIIQCWPLEESEFRMNENGLDMGVFEAGRKSCDAFSHLKSNNYLLYALAAQYAKQQKWNETAVLNVHGRICDTTIANLFFIKDDSIHTPQLSEGCVAGVMRAYLLEQLNRNGIKMAEGFYTVDDLLKADELFLTNAFYGIRWVKQLGEKHYSCEQSAKLFQQFIRPLF
jgi:branched-chain amino acid aminotransferase